jgi:TP901-1 family phage major tail protein
MAGQKGSDVLIKVDSDGAGTFVTVGGLRSKSISLNAETVDVSDSDSSNKWRELLANAGMKSATITGSGVFKDSAGEEDIRGFFFAQTLEDYQFIVPDFGTVEGPFQVTAIDYAGEYNAEATYSMTFESAGELTFTAAS